mgnify:CR=1 FL=1
MKYNSEEKWNEIIESLKKYANDEISFDQVDGLIDEYISNVVVDNDHLSNICLNLQLRVLYMVSKDLRKTDNVKKAFTNAVQGFCNVMSKISLANFQSECQKS